MTGSNGKFHRWQLVSCWKAGLEFLGLLAAYGRLLQAEDRQVRKRAAWPGSKLQSLIYDGADEVRKERNKALKKDVALRLAGMIHKVSLYLMYLLCPMAAPQGPCIDHVLPQSTWPAWTFMVARAPLSVKSFCTRQDQATCSGGRQHRGAAEALQLEMHFIHVCLCCTMEHQVQHECSQTNWILGQI